MSGIETHNFSGSRHDHNVPTLRQGHWKSSCFINVLMWVIGSFCCISVSGSSPAECLSWRIDKFTCNVQFIACYVCHCVYLFWRYNLHAQTPGNAMSSSVCIKPGKGGVVYICVRGFNVSICSTRFWTVLTMVFCVFSFYQCIAYIQSFGEVCIIKAE